MKTIVYEKPLHKLSLNSKIFKWYWAPEDNYRREHGPFETEVEARDAAGAAEITANAEQRTE